MRAAEGSQVFLFLGYFFIFIEVFELPSGSKDELLLPLNILAALYSALISPLFGYADTICADRDDLFFLYCQ